MGRHLLDPGGRQCAGDGTVGAFAADDCWAVGDYGALFHWDGRTWTEAGDALDDHLTDVSMVSSDDGWAVSDYPGSLFHWDGRNWLQRLCPAVPCHPRSVVMLASEDGWIAGDKGLLLRWDGHEWRQVAGPTGGSILYLDAVSTDNLWGVGGDSVFRWDRSDWSEIASIDGWRLSSLAMTSSDDGWLIASRTVSTDLPTVVQEQMIMHWDGSSWSTSYGPVAGRQLMAIGMASAADGWCSTGSLTPLRWNGSAWSESAHRHHTNINAIDMVSEDDGWAVGNAGSIDHWDGQTWSWWGFTGGGLQAISMLSADDGWAVGDEGAIVHWDGTEWTDLWWRRSE